MSVDTVIHNLGQCHPCQLVNRAVWQGIRSPLTTVRAANGEISASGEKGRGPGCVWGWTWDQEERMHSAHQLFMGERKDKARGAWMAWMGFLSPITRHGGLLVLNSSHLLRTVRGYCGTLTTVRLYLRSKLLLSRRITFSIATTSHWSTVFLCKSSSNPNPAYLHWYILFSTYPWYRTYAVRSTA